MVTRSTNFLSTLHHVKLALRTHNKNNNFFNNSFCSSTCLTHNKLITENKLATNGQVE